MVWISRCLGGLTRELGPLGATTARLARSAKIDKNYNSAAQQKT